MAPTPPRRLASQLTCSLPQQHAHPGWGKASRLKVFLKAVGRGRPSPPSPQRRRAPPYLKHRAPAPSRPFTSTTRQGRACRQPQVARAGSVSCCLGATLSATQVKLSEFYPLCGFSGACCSVSLFFSLSGCFFLVFGWLFFPSLGYCYCSSPWCYPKGARCSLRSLCPHTGCRCEAEHTDLW